MKFRWSALVLASAFALFGCYDIQDIDRTQPNKIRKTVFEGEWIYHPTVIGVPYTTTFTFIGEQPWKSEMIKWDIQEQFLVAYRSYDQVAGTDLTAALPGDHPENVAIAIFPIQGHFDVVREYNPNTGEQTNVIIENTFDRPWYDREFMRVDWSQNLAPNFSFLVGPVGMVPGSHFVQEPDDPDALLLGQKGPGDTWEDFQGDSIATVGSADYIDVVQRVMASPETFYWEDWDGTVYEEPACWYYGNYDCSPAEITIRSAFLKRDPNNTYEAKPYPDNEILRDENGDPITVTYSGEDNASLTPDPGGFVARAPMFDKFGFFRTERERYDRQRGEETVSGQVLLINRFKIWEDEAGCVDENAALTHANCEVKPIVYFTSRGFPEDVRDEAQATMDAWNDAFKEVVRARKYGQDTPLDQVEDVVILRDNTFTVAEDGSITDRGQRYGDIRFNMFAWVDHPNQAGLLGYGPAVVDPITGEILQASSFNYGAGIDRFAERGRKIIELINDPSRLFEFIGGDDVRREVHIRSRDEPAPREKVVRFVRDKVNSPRNRDIRRGGIERLRLDGGEQRARLAALRDTPLEARLMNDHVVRAMAGRTSASVDGLTQAELNRSSPASWAMGQRAHRERERQRHLSRHNVMHSDAFDPSIIGLALDMQDLSPEEAFAVLRGRIFKSTADHEVGHNFGLRHNYEGSTDALNYGQTYWDLRGTGGQALDDQDQAQIDAGMRQHQYASIMDYSSRFSSDLQGIGAYDKAAIAFGYGDLVTTFAGLEGSEPNEPLLEVFDLEVILRNYRHYTKLPDLFGGIEGMHDRKLVPYEEIVSQLKGESTWTHWEVPFRFCSDEYDGFTATCAAYDEGADAFEITRAARNQYLDYYALLSFQRDNRWFNEWDYMSRVYWRGWYPMQVQYQNWVFDGFNNEFEYECLVTDDDFCDFVPGENDADYFNLDAVPWAEADDGGLAGAAGSRMLLDTIGEVLAMPEPGAYFYDPAEDLLLNYSVDTDQLCPPGQPRPDCSELNVPFGVGRPAFSVWDFDSGYYFYDRLQMVGSFYDKMLALESAVISESAFLGVDAGSQLDTFAIGLNLFFPEEVYRMVGGASAEDYGSFASVMCEADRSFDVRLPSTTDPVCDGGAFQLVDPATSFTVELYAIWYGMAFLQDSFDTSFNDRIKIWIDGAGEQITVTDPNLLVSFTNPLNNRTYFATNVADPNAYAPGPALLQRAQGFADAFVADPTPTNRFLLENLVSTIEDVRGTYDIYGYFWF
jgi:hypothetical protein